jgi:hypothetical protein
LTVDKASGEHCPAVDAESELEGEGSSMPLVRREIALSSPLTGSE